jgi:DNA sulfur modification protein DndE
LFSLAMNANPPPQDQINALLPMFQPLGIELGKPWDRSKLNPVVLEAMTEAATTTYS